ncbi:MAG: sn-glycerol-1-phosphate dehydrogenase [Clostridiales bacterium]|nr:sn-glycerol-1-phosphate dehydrogenase [Clostridiales bacterium]
MLINANNLLHGDDRRIETECIVIEEGCLHRFNDILRQCGVDGAIVGLFDTNTVRAVGMHVPAIDQMIVLNANNLHADEAAVRSTLLQLREDVKVIAAFGSGTVTDIARYCAKLKNLILVCCPTAASVDGFCSSVCAMTFNHTKVTVPAIAPKIVIADLAVIKNAPDRLVKSGLGDILGKYVSLADWKVAHLVTGEFYCEKTVKLVKDALNAVTDLVNNDILQGDDFYLQITYALLLSGLAMQLVGSSRPASGAEHHFSHLLTIAPPTLGIHTDALHGESVGVGTLAIAEHYRKLATELQMDDSLAQQIEKTVAVIRQKKRIKNIAFYRRNFDTLADMLYKENENDCLAAVNAQSLQDNWQEIKQVLLDIPSVEELKSMYSKLGMKNSLSDIGVEESKKSLVIKLSPYIRNRLTFNRLSLLINEI